MNYKRQQLTGSIGYTEIIDPKFKTNTVKIKFITPLNADTAALNSIAAGIITATNYKYKTMTDLTEKLSALYGTGIDSSVSRCGDMQVITLSLNLIDTKFTFGHEDILTEALEIFTSCIFKPRVLSSAPNICVPAGVGAVRETPGLNSPVLSSAPNICVPAGVGAVSAAPNICVPAGVGAVSSAPNICVPAGVGAVSAAPEAAVTAGTSESSRQTLHAFDPEIFGFKKKDLIEAIDAEINNKRTYAVLQAGKHIYENEPCAVPSNGTKENAQSALSETVYGQYRELLKAAQIEIYYVGVSENPSVKEILTEQFGKISRDDRLYEFKTPSPLKKEVRIAGESLDVNQANIVMAFKTGADGYYQQKLFNTILGETPFSKLFVNVREKQSLCYYCSSSFNNLKNTVAVSCGIEKSNSELVKTEISRQIDGIKAGNFTQEEIDNSVLSIINSLKSVGDTPSSYVNWCFSNLVRGETLTPEEEIARYRSVTKQQIIEAAEGFALDTVYLVS
ncbi:MAG: insulinase family protein [Oscillospiraceae bacterium]|jgi:hypothetical protein|nr:insulinase family protein [Oscillospiraceae bacterium]